MVQLNERGHHDGMFDVRYRAEAFPNFVARNGVLHFDAADLAHALFVTGRAPGDQVRHGDMSFWEWVHRTSLVPAYVRRTSTGRLMKSALADSLDRSEKVALSYALGQAMTGIFAQRNLGVTHLMHVDRYADRWRLGFGLTRRRADLFGRIGPARWVVAEAKGRSNGMEASLRDTLVAQKGSIRTVAGHPPAVSFGCVASFPVLRGGVRGPMRLDAFDPKPSKEAIELDVDEARFLVAYYEPFVVAIAAGRRYEGPPGYAAASLDAVGVRVGLRQDLYTAVAEQDSGAMNAMLDVVGSDLGHDGRPDGTFVETDFDEALSRRDYDG